MSLFSFPGILRLKQRFDFLRFSRKETVYKSSHFVIQVKVTTLPCVRLGITVAKRYGKAVARNQFRRRVKEVFRLSSLRNGIGFDIHVRAIHSLPVSYQDICLGFQYVQNILY